MKNIIVLCCLLVGLIVAIMPAQAQVSARDAWARASAGPSKIGAAYLKLTNSGAGPDRLISAASPVARVAELHATIQDGDVMRMKQLDAIDLGAGATLDFAPGGLHIMLIDLAAPLKQGAKFPLTLTFASGASLTIEVAVMGPGAMGAGPMHRH